ncbi:hypothetical protein [Shewanella colwelliana]|uniref:hypothetical protein n=1 Tax=Shewanella colwelliana TaxID=23 RepID=UPI0022B00520|nr:hypothetical protein [Shewanella colwelliana]MCZ4338727.1 hypothetical protein [Shewanella colwelliana]
MKAALVFALGLTTCTAVSATTSLKTAFDTFSDSWLNTSYVFTCGSDTYKLEKTFPNNTSFYRKFGLEWKTMTSLLVKDTGVEFSGLAISGNLPRKAIPLNVDLPIHNGKDDAWRYFTLSKSRSSHPLANVVDFYEAKMITRNIADATHYLMFDSAKYIVEQKVVSRPNELGVYSQNILDLKIKLELLKIRTIVSHNENVKELNQLIADTKLQITEVEQAKEQKTKEKNLSDSIEDLARLMEVEATAKLYVNGITVKAPAGSYLETSYCRASE